MNTFRGFFLVHKWWNAKYHRRKHKHCFWNLSCWKTRHDWWFRQIFVLQKGWSHWHKSIFRVAVFTCSFEVEHVWSWNNMTWNGKQLFWSNDVTQLLHFYIKIHKSTWAESWRYDNFACMWSFFESFNKNISKFYYPSSYLAVDKTLYPYHGRIGFKQFNHSKPAKYGLQYRSLCDATVPDTSFPCLTLVSWKFLIKKI